ncbi:hypothetical protein F5X98DRAFT_239200 [Xylaria grammica]|nr:hypothetical protein F5X98DRAFT_239200 [Xylaria grammica]
MADWDAATASAVAALIVAIFALVVAIAQATPQYLITGQLIRMCDSITFGPMPGQGRRVWQFSQFRFRVIYSVPQICLETHLWPRSGAHMKPYAIGEHELPPLADADGPNETDMVPPPLEILLYGAQIPKKSSWRTLLDRFLHKGEQLPVPNLMSDLHYLGGPNLMGGVPVNSAPRTQQKKGFKLPISLPSTLRRRRPSPKSSYSSGSNETDRIAMGQNHATQRLDRWRATAMRLGDADSEQLAPNRNSSQVGEASWVSFCRVIEAPCGRSIRVDMVEYDADRCPSDLISVPMQVSMRDVAIMALMAGMELTSASFDEKSISMQGAVGTLTSSNHPILGPILHFTPRNVDDSLPKVFGIQTRDVYNRINEFWMPRTWDTCTVAGSFYNSTRRRTVRRLDDRWIRDREGAESYGLDTYSSSTDQKKKTKRNVPKTGDGSAERPRPAQAVAHPRNMDQIVERRIQDGDWVIVPAPLPLPARIVRLKEEKNIAPESSSDSQILRSATDAQKMKGPTQTEKGLWVSDMREVPAIPTYRLDGVEGNGPVLVGPGPGVYISYSPLPRRVTVEDVPDDEGPTHASSSKDPGVEFSPLLQPVDNDGNYEIRERPSTPPNERAKLARERQDARAERLRQIQEDKAAVNNVMKRGAMGSPYEEAEGMLGSSGKDGPLLLTNYAHNPEKQAATGSDPTAEETAAHEREKMREKERLERDIAREDRNRARNRAAGLTNVDIFWLCQVDVMSGSWATPWHANLPISSALDGAVTVILEALMGFLDEGSSLLYTTSRRQARFRHDLTADWLLQGNFTCPAYGQNARGGVIASGIYHGVHIPHFAGLVPVLDLMYSYDWQVDSNQRDHTESIEDQNVEVMLLDAWLSYTGRLREIAEGPHDLLSQAPALVQLLMEEFEIDFQNIDLSAHEGGLQDIQGLKDNVMDFLTDEELTQPEQLYMLVALLRGVKVAQCVLAGSDTKDLRDILLKDVQAHLV